MQQVDPAQELTVPEGRISVLAIGGPDDRVRHQELRWTGPHRAARL